MTTLDEIQATKDSADRLFVDMTIKSKEMQDLLEQSKLVLKNIKSTDGKYQVLAAKILAFTNTATETLNKFQVERKKISDLYSRANTFFNEKYTPLIEKLENQDTGFSATIKKGVYFTTEIEKISKNCKKQYEQITKYVKDYDTTLAILQNINKSVKDIYREVQKYKSDSKEVVDSISNAYKKVDQLEKNIDRLNKSSILKESEIIDLYNQTNLAFDEITEIKGKSQSTFEDILTIYGMSADTGRSGEFDKRRKALTYELVKWEKHIVHYSIFLFVVVIALFISQLWLDHWDIERIGKDINFYFRYILTSPIIFYISFASFQYSRTKKLVDKYSFKTTLAVSIESHLKLLQSNPKFNDEPYISEILKFSLSALNNIYQEPYSEDDSKFRLKLLNSELCYEKLKAKKFQEQVEKYVPENIKDALLSNGFDNIEPIIQK